MKNSYEIQNEKTIIFINRPDGEILDIIIDTEDLEKVKRFPTTWGATNIKGKRWQIKGSYREDEVKKSITLSRYIKDVTDSSPVRFINSDQLDHRKRNLTVGYKDVQIKKGNDYEIKGDKAYLSLNRRKGDPLITQIDTEDLERVLAKGTWFAEWHEDFKDYLVQNVSYYYVEDKKRREKITLHSFIMGLDNQERIRHVDKDTRNNSKLNLKIHGDDMMNDCEEVDGETVAVILRDINGGEKARTLIDKEDFERVKANGYTWFYYQGNGYPYAVSSLSGKRIYLHRFIMNTPKGMVVDHLDHKTLDNRKQNLMNVTVYENQQNRIGPRKKSKSGIRGVSWDETHQDWIVNVQGTYFGRFKNIELAKKLAEQKIEELMPYLSDL